MAYLDELPHAQARLRERLFDYQRMLANGFILSERQMAHYHQLCDALNWIDKHDPETCDHTFAASSDRFCSNCGAPLQSQVRSDDNGTIR